MEGRIESNASQRRIPRGAHGLPSGRKGKLWRLNGGSRVQACHDNVIAGRMQDARAAYPGIGPAWRSDQPLFLRVQSQRHAILDLGLLVDPM